MTHFAPALMQDIRSRFAHVDTCPFTGPRVFFENAGGALTLNSVVDTSARFAAIPDNQGRDNPASDALMQIIQNAKADMATFFGTNQGRFFVGESGTELLFRLLRTAIMQTGTGGCDWINRRTPRLTQCGAPLGQDRGNALYCDRP